MRAAGRILVASVLLQTLLSAGAARLDGLSTKEKRWAEQPKIFEPKEIADIQTILDRAAETEAGSNITAIEMALQTFLLDKTDENSAAAKNALFPNGKGFDIPDEELQIIHEKLELVGKLLRESLDNFQNSESDELQHRMRRLSVAVSSAPALTFTSEFLLMSSSLMFLVKRVV